MLNIFALTVIAVVIGTCTSANDLEKVNEGNETTIYEGQGDFSADLLATMGKIYPTGNVIFAPQSIYRSLLIAYFGAEGETERSLKEALYLNWAPNKEAVAKAFKAELVDRAARVLPNTIGLDIVDKVYITVEANLESNLTDIIGSSQIEKVDFSDPETVRTQANAFVKEATKGHIQQLLPPESIFAISNFVLANAVFFKGQWENPFNLDNTKVEAFNGPNQKSVPMMTITDQFYHGVNKEFNFSYLISPYIGKEFLIAFYLPDENSPTAVDDLLSKLTVRTLEGVDTGQIKRVEVKVPKMSLKSSFCLDDVLENMNITHLFAESDFSGFADNVHVQLDDIFHEAVFDIDENGTSVPAAPVAVQVAVPVAAPTDASTAASHSAPDSVEPDRFHLNHPFIFALYDIEAGVDVLTGIYRGPQEDEPSISTPLIAAQSPEQTVP